MRNVLGAARAISSEIAQMFCDLNGGSALDYGCGEIGRSRKGTKPNLECIDQDPTATGSDLISDDNNLRED